MKKRIFIMILFLIIVVCAANLVTEYAMYASGLQTYGMAKFNIPLTVVCTGIIIFFVEKNGFQTRKKIEKEFDELHATLTKEKNEAEKVEQDPFRFTKPSDDIDD